MYAKRAIKLHHPGITPGRIEAAPLTRIFLRPKITKEAVIWLDLIPS
jgi:hypothetical protein